jgi:hypothetical protein
VFSQKVTNSLQNFLQPAVDSSIIHHGGGKPKGAVDPKIIAFFVIASGRADYENTQSSALRRC